MWCGMHLQNFVFVRAKGNSMRRMKNEYLSVILPACFSTHPVWLKCI
jgi:hypothetical protein